MKKLYVLLVVALFATGCKETFRGQLELQKGIAFINGLTDQELKKLAKCEAKNSTSSSCKRLKKKKEKHKQVILAGVHKAKVVPGKKTIKMQILDDSGKKLQEFSVDVPKKMKLPKNNGEIDIPAAKSGFNYDINGVINTEITHSENHSGYESCSWTESYEVCEWERTRIPDCEGRGCWEREYVCETHYETYYGEHHVEYYYEYTDKDLAFEMVKPSNDELIGTYEGEYHNTEKIYTYQGTCH